MCNGEIQIAQILTQSPILGFETLNMKGLQQQDGKNYLTQQEGPNLGAMVRISLEIPVLV